VYHSYVQNAAREKHLFDVWKLRISFDDVEWATRNPARNALYLLLLNKSTSSGIL
jgi:hypothetical protein